MDYESIAHEAEGRMGHWLIGYEGESNNCFSKNKTLQISLLVGYNNIAY